MTILLSGGGTGGHITPILAVAHELKQLQPDCRIVYVGERNGKYASLTDNNPDIDEVRTIFAGKFRRYHGESWLQRLLDFKTNLLNLRDLFSFLIGTFQSLVLVKRINPDVVLLKGGFVGVPVGFSAAFWRIPFITHDSDTLPGLANRIVGRWAKYHATGMPPDFYKYPKDSIKYVGVLVESAYIPVTVDLEIEYRKTIGVPEHSKVLLITGGSGGAANINLAMREILPSLLDKYPELHVIHQVGIGKAGIYEDFKHERLLVMELLRPMHVYTGSSSLVVTRAGANTIAELGIQGKACVVIPNPLLTGGHQLINAKYLEEQQAAIIFDETLMQTNPDALAAVIGNLLEDPTRRKQLGSKLQSITPSDSAHQLALLLLELAKPIQDVQEKETAI